MASEDGGTYESVTQHAADLNIEPVTNSTSPDALIDLWTGEFGNYPDTDQQMELINRVYDHDDNTWAWTASTRRHVVGVLIGEFFPIEEFGDRFAADTSDWPKAVENAELSLLAVADRWQNRGVGTALTEHYLEYAAQYVSRVFAVSWLRDDHADSSLLFESLDFERLGEESDYYDIGEHERYCPDCGLGCSCSAAFYTRTLGDADA